MCRYCRLLAILAAFVLLLTACDGGGVEVEDELPPDRARSAARIQ